MGKFEEWLDKKAIDYDDNFEFTGEYSSVDMDDSFRQGAKASREYHLEVIKELVEVLDVINNGVELGYINSNESFKKQLSQYLEKARKVLDE